MAPGLSDVTRGSEAGEEKKNLLCGAQTVSLSLLPEKSRKERKPMKDAGLRAVVELYLCVSFSFSP